MIVIRGIRGEKYARQIETGIVSCRDILSALLTPPQTNYAFSDFYEKNLVEAITQVLGKHKEDFRRPEVLFTVLIDFYIPYIYLCYFHILNTNSLDWLHTSFDSSDDDMFFIALNIELDRITKHSINREIIGSKLNYIDSIKDQEQTGYKHYRTAVMCSIEDLFSERIHLVEATSIYNTLFFPLLSREQDLRFSDIENEFRVIAYDCPRFVNGVRTQKERDILINGSGFSYKGKIVPGEDYILKNTNNLLTNPNSSLSEILNSTNGDISVESCFKPVNIKSIASSYKFIGRIADCERYINEKLSQPQEELYVDKTIIREYKFDEISDVEYFPSNKGIKY